MSDLRPPAGAGQPLARTTSLRGALLGLCVALFVPLLLLASALLVDQWLRQRDQAVDRLREQAAALRLAMEAEATLDLAVLSTLASLPEFDRQDWRGLHATASAAATLRPGSWIVVASADDRRLLNTFFPADQPLPPVLPPAQRASEVMWQGRPIPAFPGRLVSDALRTGQPTHSGLIYGPLVRGPVVTITVPVLREGHARYALSLAYTPQPLVTLLEGLSKRDGLVRVVFDADGRVIARSLGAASFIGRRVAPPLDQGLGDRPPDGTGEAVSLDGVPVFFAYSRSALNGWAVGVATPRATVLEPARRSLAIWLAVLSATGLGGLVLATRLWRRLAVPLAALADQARALDASSAGEVPSGIAEVDLLRGALQDAAAQQRQRRLAEQQLERAEGRLREVVESSPAGILMVDERGVITLVNRRIEAFFGYPRDELLGQPLERLVPPSRREQHGAHLAAYLAKPEARAMGAGRDLHGVRKDGTEFPIEIGLVPLQTAEGRFVLASVADITERKRAEDELRRSNHDLEQFAYVASHDLQEPLRMVANYTALLGQRYQGRLDAKADTYIHYAVDGARRMQALISDLLAFSRVGSEAKDPSPADAGQALKQAMDMLQPQLAAASARVDVGALPVVLADDRQLVQVFQNLVGNAIKFRGEQPLHIAIDAQRADGRWQFSVTDNGIGFDPRYADRIFMMYQRLHERGRYDGSGIGLAIVRRIVERHGGRVWAVSQPGHGATFHFTLPAVPAAPALDHPTIGA